MVKAAMPSVTLITARAEALPLRSLTISIASATATPPRRPDRASMCLWVEGMALSFARTALIAATPG